MHINCCELPHVPHQVRDGASQVTLAIGDGANDVSMIQARTCRPKNLHLHQKYRTMICCCVTSCV